MPSATFRFVDWNYLPIGNGLRVAAVLLNLSTDRKHFDFETVIPASYEIIAPDVGTLMVCSTASGKKERFLSASTHTFAQTSTGHDLVVFCPGRRSPFQTYRVVTSLDS
jgi:hypothetical protein